MVIMHAAVATCLLAVQNIARANRSSENLFTNKIRLISIEFWCITSFCVSVAKQQSGLVHKLAS